jgi:Omp85 superfamily domain
LQEFDVRAAFPLSYFKSSLNLGVSSGLITPFGKEITDLPSNMAYKFHFSTTSPTSRLGGLSLFGLKPNGSTLLETSSSDATGGDIVVTAFADLSFDLPVKFLREKGVYGHAFVNAGNVIRLKENDWKKLSLTRILDTCRSSAGVGFVLLTKIFRFEVCILCICALIYVIISGLNQLGLLNSKNSCGICFHASMNLSFLTCFCFYFCQMNYCYIIKQFQNDGGKTGIQLNFSSP